MSAVGKVVSADGNSAVLTNRKPAEPAPGL
jgi:hypothetical protein